MRRPVVGAAHQRRLDPVGPKAVEDLGQAVAGGGSVGDYPYYEKLDEVLAAAEPIRHTSLPHW